MGWAVCLPDTRCVFQSHSSCLDEASDSEKSLDVMLAVGVHVHFSSSAHFSSLSVCRQIVVSVRPRGCECSSHSGQL